MTLENQPGSPPTPLRILLLEDVAWDAELIQKELGAIGLPFTLKVVATEAAFYAALREPAPDLVLADFSLPTFDGLTALAIARERCHDIPFIFVSGSIGEEKAVALLRDGATDLVLKHNLARLGPAVTRALRESERRAEARRAIEAVHEAIAVLRETKRSFKSKVLADLRQKLERLATVTPWW